LLRKTKDEISLTSDHWKSKFEQCKEQSLTQQKQITELTSTNDELNQKLRQNYSDRLVSWNRQFWLGVGEKNETQPSKLHFIDPIYELLELEEDLSKVFQIPLVQRLARVRQLSFTYLDQPLGQHNRLAHSLGVCKNMELALSGMLRRNELYSSKGIEKLSERLSGKNIDPTRLVRKGKLLGLLHDIGHGPFGHSLDRYLGFRLDRDIKAIDKSYSVSYIETYMADAISAAGFDPADISRILSHNREKLTSFDVLLADLIDSALDTDRLDFLVRDAYTTGLQLGLINPRLILEFMAPYEDSQGRVSLTFQKEALDFLEHFLYARSIMYARCYERDTKVSAEGMLILAVDDFLPRSVQQPQVDNLMLLDDEMLLDVILTSGDESRKSVKLAKMLKLGRVYPKVYQVDKKSSKRLLDWINQEARKSISASQFITPHENWAREIAKLAGLRFEDDGWKILVVPPSPNVYREVEVDISILEHDEEGYTALSASDISPTLEDIQRIIYEAQQVVRVFVHPELDQQTKRKIRESSAAFFTK